MAAGCVSISISPPERDSILEAGQVHRHEAQSSLGAGCKARILAIGDFAETVTWGQSVLRAMIIHGHLELGHFAASPASGQEIKVTETHGNGAVLESMEETLLTVEEIFTQGADLGSVSTGMKLWV